MSFKIICFTTLLILIMQPMLHAQDSSRVALYPKASEDMILAVANVQSASMEKSGELADVLKTFNQVLWDDLSFSGFFTLAARSFYPPEPIVHPETDINYDAWKALSFKVSFLTVGTVYLTGGVFSAELSVYDMKQRQRSFGKAYTYTGDINQIQIRKIAHYWADEIVYQLTAGTSRGIASTKIAYGSRKGNAKEIYIMDYDGYNSRAFTHNNSLNLFPNWAPDNSKLAFVSYRPYPEISIYSYIDGSRLPFQTFNALASAPAISPNGTEIAFCMRTPRGDSDVFISKLDGSARRNISNSPTLDSSPTWSPSGKQIAYISGTPGQSQIYISDTDGSNLRKIVKEGGDSDSVTWSPDGKWLAFHWKPRLSANYDIFVASADGGMIRQITSNGGSNESPSWAPDGRHIVFQSNRTGSWQIYTMLLEGTEARRITNDGSNTFPAWSGYFSRDSEK
jgi:TolB protein